MKVLIVNGPNVNMQRCALPGYKETLDYDSMVDYIHNYCIELGIEAEFYHSNHEGDLIDEIQNAPLRADALILNPGGYAHTSVAMLDALRTIDLPVAEVMLDKPSEREPFRQVDLVSFGCQAHFIGQGLLGYLSACSYLAQAAQLDHTGAPHLAM